MTLDSLLTVRFSSVARQFRPRRTTVALLAFFAFASSSTSAAESEADKLRFFETSIRPVLVANCLKCHGEEKQWANLRLDSREAILKGGDNGPAAVSGKPAESLLMKAIRQTDEDLQMPPDGKLSDRQIADFSKWIEGGVAFPATASASAKNKYRDPSHWAFQPVVRPSVPDVKNIDWVRTEIDRFILARLESEGLTPSGPADSVAWIRRVTFDLTGLPPTPEEVKAFLSDSQPGAYERLVDRLLASPAYGERWGRHWLDVARYADSNGLDENVAYGNAWKYRDYVVQSLNADKPYDQFLREQIAGDLLPRNEAQRDEFLTATGFLSLGAKVLAEVDEAKMEMDIVDEQIDTFGKAVLGMTFGCSRCHDHKFDPIDATDYYGLAGVFKSTKTMENFKKVAKWHENTLPTPESEAKAAAHKATIEQRKLGIKILTDRADELLRDAAKPGEKLPEKRESLYPQPTKDQLKLLREELAALEKTPPATPSAMGVGEGQLVHVAVHLRGNPLKLGEMVKRRVPKVLAVNGTAELPESTSGRLDLANWAASPKNPLTARVFVNRVWRWHFGKGLVHTTDNFGVLGERPSHPDLLDWMADRFVQDGWSVKSLHRLILLSSVYRQSSTPVPGMAERDAGNLLYTRSDVRRLEAEAIRDAMLAVAGKLEQGMGGSLLTVKNRDYLFDHTSKDLTSYDSFRRSIYLPVIRNNPYDIFQLLDFPDAAIPSGDRATTTVAPQALLMLNSDLVGQCAVHFAASLLSESGNDEARIDRAYQLAYSRSPRPEELAEARKLLGDVASALQGSEPDPARREAQSWEAFAQVLLAANEFIYLK